MNNVLFHPSELRELMTSDRSGKGLGETAKSKLLEIGIREKYGRRKQILTKPIEKGILCESDSFELVSKVTGKSLFKNTETIKNDYLIGTPDVIKPFLADIKTPYDILTFFGVAEDDAMKEYYWQLLGYMELTNKKEAILYYALVNTPVDRIHEVELTTNENWYVFDDIPEKSRVKKFVFKHDKDKVDYMYTRLDLCREYIRELKI